MPEAVGQEERIGLRDRVRRRARTYDRQLFLERDHDPDRSALILGSGRSGTTWLAEAIARQCGSRLLFEPFHPCWSPVRARYFLGPTEADAATAEGVRRVLAGSVRQRQIDQVLTARLPKGRVVKDIHATNLLAWFRANHPRVPVVYVLRHPIAASYSRLNAGSFYGLGAYAEMPHGRRDLEGSPVAAWVPVYDEHRLDRDPLVRLVAEWCLENAYPVGCAAELGVPLTLYENAVLDPEPELARLIELCQGSLASGATGSLSMEELRRPSAMDWFGSAANAQGSRDWSRVLGRWTEEVSAARTERCLRVVAEFGLDLPYGADPLPSREVVGSQPVPGAS